MSTTVIPAGLMMKFLHHTLINLDVLNGFLSFLSRCHSWGSLHLIYLKVHL